MNELTNSCTCGNPSFGFDCVCDWVKAHPGNREFTCEHCGMYKANAPRCNKCEEEGTLTADFAHMLAKATVVERKPSARRKRRTIKTQSQIIHGGLEQMLREHEALWHDDDWSEE
jgi:hypothetical protein